MYLIFAALSRVYNKTFLYFYINLTSVQTRNEVVYGIFVLYKYKIISLFNSVLVEK